MTIRVSLRVRVEERLGLLSVAASPRHRRCIVRTPGDRRSYRTTGPQTHE
jgi:hypothetical protein